MLTPYTIENNLNAVKRLVISLLMDLDTGTNSTEDESKIYDLIGSIISVNDEIRRYTRAHHFFEYSIIETKYYEAAVLTPKLKNNFNISYT